MKNRIIEIHGCDTCKEILLFLDRDENDFVQIIAWHDTKDGWIIQKEKIHAHNRVMCEQIISNFAEFTANEFAKGMQF